MSVEIEQIKPGAVFRFKVANRRVVSLGKTVGSGFDVHWEYADGKKRGGKLSGSQWVHYFKTDAISLIPDTGAASVVRKLLPSMKPVPSRQEVIEITLNTHCPEKWAIVDMETGELWGHDGTRFRHLSGTEAADVAAVAKRSECLPDTESGMTL